MYQVAKGIAFLIKISTIPSPYSPKCIILNKNSVKIGRHSEVKMDTIAGKEISKKHAVIYRHLKRTNVRFSVEDTNSVNGTFVNGRKILKQNLSSKDDIIFGGGNKYCFGDMLPDPENSECVYRFIVPQIQVDFRHCVDFDMHIDTTTSEEECCVCYTTQHKMHKLHCGHSFCVSCLAHWAKVCSRTMKPVACPVCRCPFTRSEIENDSPVISNGIEVIKLIEPLLHTLSVSSVAELKEVSLIEPWDQSKKERFWRYNDIVHDLHSVKRSFHTIVNATYPQVLALKEEQLKILITNLEGNVEDVTDSLMVEAIARVAIMVMHVNKSKSKQGMV